MSRRELLNAMLGDSPLYWALYQEVTDFHTTIEALITTIDHELNQAIKSAMSDESNRIEQIFEIRTEPPISMSRHQPEEIWKRQYEESEVEIDVTVPPGLLAAPPSGDALAQELKAFEEATPRPKPSRPRRPAPKPQPKARASKRATKTSKKTTSVKRTSTRKR